MSQSRVPPQDPCSNQITIQGTTVACFPSQPTTPSWPVHKRTRLTRVALGSRAHAIQTHTTEEGSTQSTFQCILIWRHWSGGVKNGASAATPCDWCEGSASAFWHISIVTSILSNSWHGPSHPVERLNRLKADVFLFGIYFFFNKEDE